MSALVESTTKASVLVQLLTGVLGAQGLMISLSPQDGILKEILGLEMFVQALELCFYIFFLASFDLPHLAINRYFDWFITTPVMLFTMATYFLYQMYQEKAIQDPLELREVVLLHQASLLQMFLLNAGMLAFGLLGELGILSIPISFGLGTACFVGSFSILYKEFAEKSSGGRNLFGVLFALWAGYGVSFLFPIVAKNIGYNLLDILAKNFFGLYLFWEIYQRRPGPAKN